MNGQLFTQDFLARGIASSPVWTAVPEAQLDAFIEALRSLYVPYSASSELNEAIAESEIIGRLSTSRLLIALLSSCNLLV